MEIEVSTSTRLSKRFLFSAVAVFFLILGAKVGAETVFPATMSVQVAKSQIRSSASVIAPVIAVVAYRDTLNVLGIADGWARVRVPGSDKVGFLFSVALSAKTIPLSSQETVTQGVTGTEITLAGKGFNQTLEESYQKNSKMDFSWVNFMESFSYEAGECAIFVAGKGTL